MTSLIDSEKREVDLLRKLGMLEARRSLLSFIRYCWWMPSPFVEGRHTVEICNALDRAVDRFIDGKSTYIDIEVHFRAGKSDIISRAWPAYFLGRMHDQSPDYIMSGYGADLMQGFSRDVKRIIRSEAYKRVFPSVETQRGADRQDSWSLQGSVGKVTAVGLGGAVTGKGAHCLGIDDWCKSRHEAESPTFRQRVWEAFTNDLMTRLAPVHIVILCGTDWHVDDLRGRVHDAMGQDASFPRFESLRFPAKNDDGSFLFEERMGRDWYIQQYATLGAYSAAALLDCSPQVKGGNILKTDRVQIHNDSTGWPTVRHSRVWDLASTAKQRQSDDPDWTVGALGCVTFEKGALGQKVGHLWIRDCVFMREEAPKRDAKIMQTMNEDGANVPVYVENFGAYKDTLAYLRKMAAGKVRVVGLRLPGDKLVKATPLEAIFEAGNVHIMRGDWNGEWLKQHSEFTGTDGGPHDDAVDTSSMLYHSSSKPQAYMAIPGMQ